MPGGGGGEVYLKLAGGWRMWVGGPGWPEAMLGRVAAVHVPLRAGWVGRVEWGCRSSGPRRRHSLSGRQYPRAD